MTAPVSTSSGSKNQLRQQKNDVAIFGGRPDQVNGPRRAATVRHDGDSFTVPVSMNGKTDDFLLDTGALHSRLTGHKTRSVFERYNITSPGDLRDAARKLDAVTSDAATTLASRR
jgi:hypothetical protein